MILGYIGYIGYIGYELSVKTSTPQPVHQRIDKDKAREENFKSDIYFGNKRTRLTDELEDYLSLPREPGDTINRYYWRAYSKEWPLVRYISTRLPSSDSNECFKRASKVSVEKDMLDICRHSLQSTKMEACMCVRSWLRSSLYLLVSEDVGEVEAEQAELMKVKDDSVISVVPPNFSILE